MANIQTVLIGAAAMLAGVLLLVALVLKHQIGGFLRTVEREAREKELEEERERTSSTQE